MLLIFSTNITFAQKAILRGTAPGAEKKMLKVTAAGDLITFYEVTLASAKIDSIGNFQVEIPCIQTREVTISIDFHKADLLLEPGKSYKVQIAPMKYDEYLEINPFIQSQNLTVDIISEDPQELNRQVGIFNTLYSGFLMEHFNALYRDRRKVLLDTFRVQLNQHFGADTNKYFLDYASYKMAALEQLTQYYNHSQLAKKYFIDKPVLYYNLEYMDFFNSYFSKYISVTSGTIRKIDLNPVLKSPEPYKAMMKVMVTDTLLKNEQLRELVMLKGLMELYNTPNCNQDDVLTVIKETRSGSKYPENRQVADNMIKVLTKLKPGTMAPDFKLISRDLKDLSLSSLRGKPVVLNFWTTYCEGCLSEMDLIKPLFDKYQDNVHFLSVSADKYYGKMLFFINLKKDYVWKFVNVGDQSDVLIDYDVRSYPLFLLIDKDGKIVKYPASLPSNGLEEEIKSLLR